MKLRTYIALALTVTAAIPAGSTDHGVLRELAEQLGHMRSSAPDANAEMACPDKADLVRLRGLKKSEVLSALSSPDYEEEDTGTSSWSYFLTSPRNGVVDRGETLEVTAGGGFPVVTFVFNGLGKAEHVTCSYAR
jgi:hypothetical protein